jgi:SAM-dependent methyltransferase
LKVAHTARDIDQSLRDGHYAAKQIFSRDRLIAWSHRRRFETGLTLGARFAGLELLDYGCGDGTFLALLMGGAAPPARAVGVELDDVQVDDCRRRFGRRRGLSFDHIAALDGDAHRARYDGVVCMEVLEHVVDLTTVIDRLWRVLKADGTLVVSVPVETGLPLLVKQAVRRAAGWRGIGDYPGTSPYTWREYRASLVAGRTPHLDRPVYGRPGQMPFHDHKGFNWMVLRDRLAGRFVIDRVLASPIPWLGPHLATQVWFVARPKPIV